VEVLEALRQACFDAKVNVLRIVPNIANNEANQKYVEMFQASGFEPCQRIPPYRTIMLRLEASEEALRKGLHKSWRRNLRRSERNGLKVFEGYHDIYYKVFMHLYREMHARKKFVEHVDVHQFRKVQSDLPEAQRMNISLCVLDKEPIAALVWSAIGDVGITLLSATGDKGRKHLGSYLLRWELLKRLKERDCQFLDQGGVDPERNPGGYMFKAGMGGEEQFHIGAFDTYTNSVTKNAFKIGEKIYKGMKIFER
jgi:lipid II:glycine glycyltransferase (peptidoglycan interpeptide bridge formation enzyme)